METALRRLDGVDKISISMAQQRFQLTYKSGAHFAPEDIRRAVAEADVKVVRFRIGARGRVQEESGRRFFVAGKEKFLLDTPQQIPADVTLAIEGTVDDSIRPLHLNIAQFKPVR